MTNGAQFLTPKEYEAVRAILDDREKIRKMISAAREVQERAGTLGMSHSHAHHIQTDTAYELAAYVEQLVGM